jgi:hypothetical protein
VKHGPFIDEKKKEYQPYIDKCTHHYQYYKSCKYHGFDNQILQVENVDKTRIFEFADSNFKDITKFEYYVMPLKKISLETYEYRLKKLAFFNSDYGVEE